MLGYALLLRRGLFLAVVSFFFSLVLQSNVLNFKVLYLISYFFDLFLLCISQSLLWCISPSFPNFLHAPASVNY